MSQSRRWPKVPPTYPLSGKELPWPMRAPSGYREKLCREEQDSLLHSGGRDMQDSVGGLEFDPCITWPHMLLPLSPLDL